MRSLFIAVILIICAIKACEGALDPTTATLLVEETNRLHAPVSETSRRRIQNKVFGTGRASRSTDIVIINLTPKEFILVTTRCNWGGFSTGLFPERKLPPQSSILYGIGSNSFLSGTECDVRYNSEGEATWFRAHVDNPYFAKNRATQAFSTDLVVSSIVGTGNNNLVKFVVDLQK